MNGTARGFWRLVRRVGLWLIALAAATTVAVTAYHWSNGASLDSALRMMADDYRLLAACPTNGEVLRNFLDRTPRADGGYSAMSIRYGGGWTDRVCEGDLAYRVAAGGGRAPASPTPTPAPQPNLQPEIDKAIEEALATPTPSPTATLTPSASPTPVATPTPTATSPPTATPTPTALPADHPSQRHLELKRFMLDLINAARAEAGLGPVVLGRNAAAQLHADDALAGCFSSHWGADGLKPYMRYSLAGGYQSNGENVSGLDYCVTAADGYRAIGSVEEEVREAMDGWMESPGHRRNILTPGHKAVNIGLAWDRYNFMAVQHFEGGYVEYERAPSITDGWLELAGVVKNGVAFAGPRDLGVQVYYDPPPHALTRGQLARTYCYSSGLPVAGLRMPLSGRRFYTEDEYTTSVSPCPNPYNVPADARAPRSVEEAHAFWQAAYDASQSAPEQPVTVPWITAREWRAEGNAFSLRADLSETLARHGPGVYSIVVWGTLDGKNALISEYAIFHETTPPAGYRQYR